jgi:hypothetical protein
MHLHRIEIEEHATPQLLGSIARKLLMSTRASSNKLPGWKYFFLNLVTLEKQRSVAQLPHDDLFLRQVSNFLRALSLDDGSQAFLTAARRPTTIMIRTTRQSIMIYECLI